LTHEERKALIVKDETTAISLSRQANLLGISRGSLYYAPIEDGEDERIKGLIDRIYTDCPFYGSRRMRIELAQSHETLVGRDHVRRLMGEMGIEAVYPRKKRGLSQPDPEHEKYPYLLRGVAITRPNQIWGSDITYIKLAHGFAYLMAILDWYSRYVVAWKLSRTLDTAFCIDALKDALTIATPEIWNTDQGVQFTSRDLTSLVLQQNIKISMDGRGRCMDNIFTERLWRTLKYENVYLRDYENDLSARSGIGDYFFFYNNKRIHSSLNYATPSMIYHQN
jgi:putative transposase